MVSGIYWSKGARAKNEDSIALESVRTDRGECTLLLVSDGIGSLDYGELASGYVTEELVKWFYKYAVKKRGYNRRFINKTIRKTVLNTHMQMKKYGRKTGIKFGATCALVCIWKNRYLCMNIGDSRILLLKNDKKNTVIQMGSTDRNERGELTKCVGNIRYEKPWISWGRFKRGEGMLVCTDGFIDKIGASEIATMLHMNGEIYSERVDKRLASIGEEVGKRGGTDNRSAVYVLSEGGIVWK